MTLSMTSLGQQVGKIFKNCYNSVNLHRTAWEKNVIICGYRDTIKFGLKDRQLENLNRFRQFLKSVSQIVASIWIQM